MTICDAHLHLVQCKEPSFSDFDEYFGCTCAHSEKEFLEQERLVSLLSADRKITFVSAFGLHPQNPDLSLIPFLEKLCEEKRIGAIGETGFDFFTEDFKADRPRQKLAFEKCLTLATEHSLPLVIHDRKALDEIFSYKKELKKIKSVLFHSFAFGSREAESLLSNGMNAYFSFGKQILNGNKKSIDCVKNLTLNRLLLETDAPFQTLKGELFTKPEEISRVYKEAALLRGITEEEICLALHENFLSAYGAEFKL